jgi:hypothetical protein
MGPLKAHVKKGQIVLEEPAELPDGKVLIYVEPANDDDELDDAERAALHRELDKSAAQAEAGLRADAAAVLAKLRARS